MRQEPKIYETTKSNETIVDSNVVELQVSNDNFHGFVSRFFLKFSDFLKWNFKVDSDDEEYNHGYEYMQKHGNGNGYDYDGHGYGYRYGTGYSNGIGYPHDD